MSFYGFWAGNLWYPMHLDKCLCVGFQDQMCYHIMLSSYLYLIIHIIELLLFVLIYPNKVIRIRIRIRTQ